MAQVGQNMAIGLPKLAKLLVPLFKQPDRQVSDWNPHNQSFLSFSIKKYGRPIVEFE